MSFKKTVRNAIFLAGVAFAALLLYVVGVHALTNLKFDAKISPDILCQIYVKENSMWETFYKYNIQNSTTTGNTLKNYTISSDALISEEVEFQLKNYTPGKNIRLSVESITIDGNTKQVNAEPAICEVDSNNTATMIVPVTTTNTSSNNSTITISLKVEEVFKIQTIGTGLANNEKYYYFASSEPVNISLTPSVGYQLPNSISKIVDSENEIVSAYTTTYTTENNTTGTATITSANTEELVLKNGLKLTCNCEKVFEIKENQAASMFASSDKIEYNSTATYLPNNGYYNYTTENETTYLNKENDFKEYKYYVEMGTYPQTEVTDSTTTSQLNAKVTNDSAIYKHDLIIKKENQSGENVSHTLSLNVVNVTLDGEKYVGTYTIDKTNLTVKATYSWFKVEPIEWIVIDRDDGGNLDDLTFKNGMFYTDKLCGKEYTGGLVLMSALTLDAHYFQKSDSNVSFQGSDVYDFLHLQTTNNEGKNLYSFASNTFSGTNSFIQAKTKYLSTKTLSTSYETDSAGGKIKIDANLFLLAGNDADETFFASKYFQDGVSEKNDNMYTYSIGISTATDFAMAHYCSVGANSPTLKQGWNVGETNSSFILDNKINNSAGYSASYWTRSFDNSNSTDPNSAVIVNYQGAIRDKESNIISTDVEDSNIGIRPCTIINLGHYYQKSFYDTYSVTNS